VPTLGGLVSTRTRSRSAGSSEPVGLLRANVLVGMGTALSRITGFVRALVLLKIADAAMSDVFNASNNAPNRIYEVLAGGVLTAALVPFFVQRLRAKDDHSISVVMSTAIVTLFAIAVAAVLAAPLITRLLVSDESYWPIATKFTRWFLPQIFFYGLVALASAILNSRKQFTAVAVAPVLTNLVAIAVLLYTPRIADAQTVGLAEAERTSRVVTWLGLGTTLSIAVNALALLPLLRRSGIKWTFAVDFRHPAVRHLVRQARWVMGYVIANQIAGISIDRLSLQTKGNLTTYSTALMFFLLPHGLLAVSVATTFAPDLASAWDRGDKAALRRRLVLGQRVLGLVMLPAAAGFAVLARPLVSLLPINAKNVPPVLIADTLSIMAIGLFFYSSYLFLLRGFYAMGDARTPFLLNVGENAVNIVLALVLVGRYGVVGLAYAFSVAYIVAAIATFVVLERRLGGLKRRPLVAETQRNLLAAMLMAAGVYGLTRIVGSDTDQGAWLRTAVGIITGVVLYAGFTIVLRGLTLRVREVRKMNAANGLAPTI
jgi:putative peptidoglycan lipid II flippase